MSFKRWNRYFSMGMAFLLLTGSGFALQSAGEKKPDTSKSETAAAAKPEEAKSATKTKPEDPKPAADLQNQDYVIGIDDVLVINVWHEPEMSRTVAVRPDGKISLPLLGEFEANGLTPRKLEDALRKKLETFITNPQISVMVQEIRSQKFSVLGEVMRPGTYVLTKPMTVLTALAIAGGLKDFAKPNKMYVLRNYGNGRIERFPVNYKNLLQGKSMNQNLELENRDTIVVP